MHRVSESYPQTDESPSNEDLRRQTSLDESIDKEVIPDNLLERLALLKSRLSIREISGAFGDLGTFIPLFVALAKQRSIHVAPAMFFAGLTNILNAMLFDCPMPVQPMKSIATFALTGVLSRDQVTTAGIAIGLILLVLGISNGIEWINRLVPVSVVSGMQIGVGISLVVHGIEMIEGLNVFEWPDCVIGAVAFAALSFYCIAKQKPIGIYLILIAIFLGAFQAQSGFGRWSFQFPVTLAVVQTTPDDWLHGVWKGAIPQLPLTTLNSVISLCALATSLYPDRQKSQKGGEVFTRREVCVSVALMNLIFCPFGAMPSCHGAGGLAGQHKFGARHGSSIAFLGAVKILLALVFGAWMVDLLDAIPSSVLGIMLILAGQELAITGLETFLLDQSVPSTGHVDLDSIRQNAVPCILTAGFVLARKTHYGALFGSLAHFLIQSQSVVPSRYTTVEADIEMIEEAPPTML